MPRPTDRLKFRAWLKDLKVMAEVQQMRRSHCGGWAVYCGDNLPWYWPGDYELDQFTGLTDRNGVEVYENDWVECDMSYKGGFLPHAGLVVWHEGVPGVATENDAGATLFHHHLARSIKVIGSIHEHPDLTRTESDD